MFLITVKKQLLRNLYMRVVLKLVPSERQINSLTLMKGFRNLYKSGGFNLTKFISKKKNVLLQTVDELRKDGVREKYLSGSL